MNWHRSDWSTASKIDVSRRGRASGSRSSISDYDLSANDNNQLRGKVMYEHHSEFKVSLRSMSAEFGDEISSSQSFAEN